MSEQATGTIMRIFGPLSALGLTLILLYLSRFWIWVGPWSQDGLFGLKIIPPNGNMVNFWLQGTWWQSFDIIIWACGGFLLLSVLQRLAARLSK
jgi:hypothetical protein